MGGVGSGSGRGGRCLIQPNTYFLANGGCYNLHYTGDIGLFERNTFTMLGAGVTQPRHAIGKQEEPEWSVVLKILYLWPGKINVYYNEKFVPAVGRIDRATVDKPAGTNFYHPITREMTLVVKADMMTDRIKLKLLKAVQVNLVIAETFDSFFVDNSVDPATLPDELVAQLPPDYVANYDPDNGNIVKQNKFVRNMASVLRINPERIRVTNIVPGNRRRLDEHGRLLQDDGLDIKFDVNEEDPCEEIECANGECMDGTCECSIGWYGELCDISPCMDGAPEPCVNGLCVAKSVDTKRCDCNEGWTGTLCSIEIVPDAPPTAMPTSVPSTSPTFGPTLDPTKSPSPSPTKTPSTSPSVAPTAAGCNDGLLNGDETDVDCGGSCPGCTLGEACSVTSDCFGSDCVANVCVTFAPTAAPTVFPTTSPTATPAPVDPFADLLNIATLLVEKAAAGTLDTGYTVTEMAVTLPPDECGVPGGDGTTCLDFCDVANGDNSTCADACGFPNGDNSTCLDQCGIPNGDNSCFLSSTSDLGAYNSCVSTSEIQRVRVVADDISGPVFLSFNGETAGQLTMPYVDEADISQVLTSLDTIGSVDVVGLLTDGAPLVRSIHADGITGLSLIVDFLVIFGQNDQPPNKGALPLLKLDLSSATNTNLVESEVSQVCGGEYNGAYTYEEQIISVLNDAELYFALEFNGVRTSDISVDATATELREALAENEQLQNIIDVFVVEDDSKYSYDSTNIRHSWLVRIYPSAGTEIMSLSEDGSPGDLPSISFSKTDQGFVTEIVKGNLPSSWVPVDPAEVQAAQAAAQAAAVEANTKKQAAKAAADNSTAPSLAEILAAPIEVVEVVHVCGDGARTTVEDCDDGNTVSKDGCSASCLFEAGWACSDYIGETSQCTRPSLPIVNLGFGNATTDLYIEEGESLTIVVELDKQLSENFPNCDVRVFTVDATASAEEDDFTALDYVISIPVNGTGGSVDFQVVDDGIYEGETDEIVLIQIELTKSSDGCVLGRTKDVLVHIADVNTLSPTAFPTPAPTASPTANPTLSPSLPQCANNVQDGTETDLDCGGSECRGCAPGGMCLSSSDCLQSNCESGICVTFSPTPSPSQVPTFHPTPSPTDSPTGSPSVSPSAAPTISPTLSPTSVTCTDQEKNGDESDIDCGGSCHGCDIGQLCWLDSDCNDGDCELNVCVTFSPTAAPTGVPTLHPTVADLCVDGILNGDESDIDCGGSCMNRCDEGAACRIKGDCKDDAICNDDTLCQDCPSLERPENNVCVSACSDVCVGCSMADDPLSCEACAEGYYMVDGSSGECQEVGQAIVRASVVLSGIVPEDFDQEMQGNFVKGMASSINVPKENVEIRSFYLEGSRRVRRLLEEGMVVNVAITSEESEVGKVMADVKASVMSGGLKKSLEDAGVEGIGDIRFDREPVAVSERGILRNEDLGNGESDDSPVLITVIVVLTVILVGIGIVMLTFFIMNRTKDATIHLQKEEVLEKGETTRSREIVETQPEDGKTEDVGSDFKPPTRALSLQEREERNRNEIPLLVRSMSINESPQTEEKKSPAKKALPESGFGSSSVAPTGPPLAASAQSSGSSGPKGPPASLLSAMVTKPLPEIKLKKQMPDILKVPEDGAESLVKVKLPPLPGCISSANNTPRIEEKKSSKPE